MRGYYFFNTDLYNKKAHSLQVVKTVEAINGTNGTLTLVVPRFRSANDLPSLFEYYGVQNPFTVVHLFNFFFSGGGRWSFIFFSLISCLYLLLLKVRGAVDYIYFRSEYFFPVAFLARLLKIPYVYEIHRVGRREKDQRWKERLARRARGVVVLTDVLARTFRSFNSTILVAHDGVDLTRFSSELTTEEARERFNIDVSGPLCLYLGTVSLTKGVDIVFENAAELPEVIFYFRGKMDMKLPPSLPPNVIVDTSFVEQHDVPAFQQVADILLLPNPANIFSQSPLKLFEYMASGRPVIASDLPNIREVLQGPGALFYRPGDGRDFVRVMKEYLARNDEYRDAGGHNKKLVRAYTWERRGERISKFIHDGF